MADRYIEAQTVAVIGAGVSGVAATVHLTLAGLKVTAFERSAKAGGIWVFDERISKDAAYPSILPSTGESPQYEAFEEVCKRRRTGRDSPVEVSNGISEVVPQDVALAFAPPGPCYSTLRNNVSTIEMEMRCQPWKAGTDEFVSHNVIAKYVQESAIANGVMDRIRFNTRVNHVSKDGSRWRLDVSELTKSEGEVHIRKSIERFDSVVIASGHYHACKIPDIPGLSEWKKAFPDRVRHSKLYRSPEEFRGQNVLLIGAGVSSTDIARDLGSVANLVFQSSRGGVYDLSSINLPPNGARIGELEAFEAPLSTQLSLDNSIPGSIKLKLGQILCGIHQVIVCTGYHVSLPFLRPFHNDGIRSEEADEHVLVTDGQQVHNLHKDIWYIPDPTLAFVGVPYHVATFSLFEFQAMALAAVLCGDAPLPSQDNMREEYLERLQRQGPGRTFHSLRAVGAEIRYVDDLVDLVNGKQSERGTIMTGHSQGWKEAYDRRRQRVLAILTSKRDPNIEIAVWNKLKGCL